MSSETRDLKKYYLWILGVIILILALWWGGSFFTKKQEKTFEPVTRLRYCGAELEELCILSFGRDVDENLVINLYVPDKDFPDFRLSVKRRTGESEYECEKFAEVPTSVYCYGEMISLQERLEIRLVSIEDESLLAYGNLTLEAILVSGQFPNNGSAAVTSIPSAGKDTPNADATMDLFISQETEPPILKTQPETTSESTSAASTPEPSYPNPSYP